MSTGQITPITIFLGPAIEITTGTSDDPAQARKLVSDQADPEWDALLRPWDLVVNTDTNASAHVLFADSSTSCWLDKDIMGAAEAFKIIRGSNRRLMPPPGADYTFYSFLCNFPRANAIQGIEVCTFNGLYEKYSMLGRTNASGVLNMQGRTHQCTSLESLIVINYVTGANCTVRAEGADSTIPSTLWTPG